MIYPLVLSYFNILLGYVSLTKSSLAYLEVMIVHVDINHTTLPGSYARLKNQSFFFILFIISGSAINHQKA